VTGTVLLLIGLTVAGGATVAGGWLVNARPAPAVTPTEAEAGGEDTDVVDPGGAPEATAVSLTLPLFTSAWVTT
jgi:hypothetical protein